MCVATEVTPVASLIRIVSIIESSIVETPPLSWLGTYHIGSLPDARSCTMYTPWYGAIARTNASLAAVGAGCAGQCGQRAGSVGVSGGRHRAMQCEKDGVDLADFL